MPSSLNALDLGITVAGPSLPLKVTKRDDLRNFLKFLLRLSQTAEMDSQPDPTTFVSQDEHFAITFLSNHPFGVT